MSHDPTIYLDTSIISAYWYKGSNVAMLARRLHTREWWDGERGYFDVWTSAFAEAELGEGTYREQTDCLKMVGRQAYLSANATVWHLMDEIISRGIVPASKPRDAAHLAISTVHEIDYLLTWNYAHLANPAVQVQMENLCERLQLVCPALVSPESIPQVRFGQPIRRRR